MDNVPKTRRIILLAALAAGLSLGGYTLVSGLTYSLGYPLDDAWIHQAYARNLGLSGEWAFIAGQPSAGSTAPLWAAILAIGYMLRVPHLLWSGVVGWVTLAVLGVIGIMALRAYVPDLVDRAWWALPVLVMEWHLVWAAGSGMETLLAGVMILVIFYKLAHRSPNWLAVGGLVGVGIWVRPDLLTLLGPVGLVVMLKHPEPSAFARGVAKISGAFLILFLPYLGFNQLLAGAIWPNTFYAKQAEYAVLREASYLSRYLSQLQLPLVGVGVLLLPGFLIFLRKILIERRWENFAGPIWWFSYLAIYAWRLPVTYQHGRYLMPAMPVYFVWGLAGVLECVRREDAIPWQRVLGRSWFSAVALVLVIFWGLGAQAYARDVGFIESEMVDVAHWIDQETPPDAFVAAHDIGALGYYGGRDLLDMAGLVSPEVIPFIRDETELARYLDANQVEYLVTFPGWYPALVATRSPIYQTQGTISPDLGGENMAVYQWRPRD